MSRAQECFEEALEWARACNQLTELFDFIPDHSWTANGGVAEGSIYRDAYAAIVRAQREMQVVAGIKLGHSEVSCA